jgi:predicted transcriptional regulator
VPSTSVHLPADLLKRIDRTAKHRRVSRNRLITDACRSIVGSGQNAWPKGFFAADRLAHKDRDLLRSTFDEWRTQIASRRSKTRPPF